MRKTLAFSKNVNDYRASAIWEDAYYNLVRLHKSLRLLIDHELQWKWLPCTPAKAAWMTNHIWTVI